MTVNFDFLDTPSGSLGPAPLGTAYIPPTTVATPAEEKMSDHLVTSFIVANAAARAGQFGVLAGKWVNDGWDGTEFREAVSDTFKEVFTDRIIPVMIDAAMHGAATALDDFTAKVPIREDLVVTPWGQVYSAKLAEQLSLGSENAMRDVVNTGLNQRLPASALEARARMLYGLDQRSAASWMAYAANKTLPKNRTLLDLTEDMMKARARVMADNEVFTALNFGRQIAYMEAQKAGLLPQNATKTWVTALDERVCPVCKPMDGVTVPLLDAFEVMQPLPKTGRGKNRKSTKHIIPPVHPRCLPGDSLVAATGVTGVSTRVYDGQMVRVRTRSGYDLRCTPNHPVLTSHGWIAAGELHSGGDVVRSLRAEWVPGADHNNDHMPPMIEEVTKSLIGSGQVATAEVPVSTEDFHGDGVGSQIAVVGTYGLLSDDVESTLCEHLKEVVLTGANVGSGSLIGNSDITSVFDGLNLSTNSTVSSASKPSPFISVGLAHAGEHGCAAIAGSDPGLYETSADDWSADGQTLAQRLLTFTSEVATDEIINVEFEAFHGEVFNFDTIPGWYIANGVFTHNCRCTIVPTERIERGIITRTARFDDIPLTNHRARLVSDAADVIFQ